MLTRFISPLTIYIFSSLALLWFHTIVRPFFGLDGSNTKSGSDAAQRILEASKAKFGDAALFLFFQGRVERLKVRFKRAKGNALGKEISLRGNCFQSWAT